MLEVPKPLIQLTLKIRKMNSHRKVPHRKLVLPDARFSKLEDLVAQFQEDYPNALIHFIHRKLCDVGVANFMWHGVAVCEASSYNKQNGDEVLKLEEAANERKRD